MIYAPGRHKPSRRHYSSEVGQGAIKHWFAGGAQFEVTPLTLTLLFGLLLLGERNRHEES